MQAFLGKETYLLADTTYIPSKSDNIPLAKKGYNSQGNYDPQVHIMYLYGASSKTPAFYRLHPGNIREVKAFKLTLLESGVKDGILVGDKGFYSKANADMLAAEGLSYILPLRRDSSLIDYTNLTTNTFKKGKNHFQHENRFIWWEERLLDNGGKVVLFLDERLALEEEEDYLTRIKTHPEKYTQEGYMQAKDRFGTLAILTNLPDKGGEELYQAYKTRMSIETMFDSMKNVLEVDKSYMQDEDTLQGWMFANHIALQWYQQIYLLLKEHKLNSKYSVKDFLLLLKEARQVKINGQWQLAEIPAALEKLLKKIDFPL